MSGREQPPVPQGPPVPEWVRTATRPTPGEIGRVLEGLDPRLVQLAREATRPTAREVAAIRPRPRPYAGWAALVPASAAVLAAFLGLVSAEPTALSGRVAEDDQVLYVLTAGQELHLGAVEVRGIGTVRGDDAGVLRVAGTLDLRVGPPVVIEVGGVRYPVRDALVHVDGDRVELEPLVVAAAVVAPERPPVAADPRTPPVVPEEVAESAPTGSAPTGSVPTGSPPTGSPPTGSPPTGSPPTGSPPTGSPPTGSPPTDADPGDAAWREVLDRLEAGGPAAERIAALESFARSHPRSRFAAEAEALALLIRGSDGDPGQVLDRLEGWLAAHPVGLRTVQLEALAAQVARDGLRDCVRARPHDLVVAERGTPVDRARAQAFLGLCARSLGRTDEAAVWLNLVDEAALDPTLRGAVIRAMEEP